MTTNSKLIVVAHAEGDDTIRVISARYATTKERKRYERLNRKSRYRTVAHRTRL